MLIIHDQTPKVENLICMQQYIDNIYLLRRAYRLCYRVSHTLTHKHTLFSNTFSSKKLLHFSCLERSGAWLHAFNNNTLLVSLWYKVQCLIPVLFKWTLKFEMFYICYDLSYIHLKFGSPWFIKWKFQKHHINMILSCIYKTFPHFFGPLI